MSGRRHRSSDKPELSMATPRSSLRISEILPAPLPGQPEWVEIHNPSDQTIDLTGWKIGDAEARTPLSGLMPPQSRLVITTPGVGRRWSDAAREPDRQWAQQRPRHDLHLRIRRGWLSMTSNTAMTPSHHPNRGLSIALEPERWIVTVQPTPGEAGVTPLLADAFRAASVKQPVSDEGRLPIVQSVPNDGSDAWMIVSFALIGVILTLVIRRWRPDDPVPEPTAGTRDLHRARRRSSR